jgi:hypothetical protein
MINNTNVENKYTTNGLLATVYPITFQGATSASGVPHLNITLKTADGTSIRRLVYNVDYELVREEIDPSTPQTESMSVPPVIGIKLLNAEDAASGNSLTITRETPFVQHIDYQVGRIDPEQVEEAADLDVLRDQELSHKFDKMAEMPLDHEARITELEVDVASIEALVPSDATPVNQLADKGYVVDSIDSATDEIYDLIPTQATAQNKLADQDFVNSSIATNTATFRGTYNSVAELNAYSGDKDNNDYAFVTGTDSLGNTYYDNYVYNGTAWAFRWRLNNSSFTAAQWAAINSNVTQADVALARSAVQPGDLDGVSGRNVGDIFFTMRNDNELNGAVECDGATYNTTDFVGAQSIGALLTAGKIPYVSLADYATALATNGSVGVFGWDGAGTTEFRVPSLNDIFVETGTAAQIGDYLKPGLPDLSGSVNVGMFGDPSGTGVFTGASAGYNWPLRGTYTPGYGGNVPFKASNSNPIYKDDVDTVQPNTVRYRAMVQLAVSATDEALETCTSVLADVANLKDHRVIAFQAPTAQNNYTWYRKYADGWVEQGGYYTGVVNAGSSVSITLPITMADDNYIVLITGEQNSNNWSGASLKDSSRTTTGFGIFAVGGSSSDKIKGASWQVSGMSAS